MKWNRRQVSHRREGIKPTYEHVQYSFHIHGLAPDKNEKLKQQTHLLILLDLVTDLLGTYCMKQRLCVRRRPGLRRNSRQPIDAITHPNSRNVSLFLFF